MARLRSALAVAGAAIIAVAAADVLAQGMPHHGGHRATPVQASPAQTPPTQQEMERMMQMMQRMTPQQMQQMQSMMQHMQGGMMGGGRATDPHAGHGPTAQRAAGSPSTAAFLAANEKMHREMALQFTGDADRDFAAAMIPHHEGAIDMARIQIQYGRDPDMRRLAEAVIREQEREIAELRAFLARQR
jgi:uncharacterized protein (DUF305 family)